VAERAGARGVRSTILRIAAALLVVSLSLYLLTLTHYLLGWIGREGDPSDAQTLVFRILGGIVLSAIVVAVLALLTTRVDRRPLGVTRASAAAATRSAAIGGLAWAAPAILAFSAASLMGASLGFPRELADTVSVMLLVFLAVLVSEAIPEELVFRGYIFTVLHERLGDWATILVQTALFTGVALLLRGYTGIVDLSLFIGMGIALGYLRLVTGSVWTSVGFHTAFQTGSQLVLSHEVVAFSGSQQLAMLAVGLVPFALGVAAIGALAPKYRRWFTSVPGNTVDS
jgi:membrane protease YdiL (CAAX protease family)